MTLKINDLEQLQTLSEEELQGVRGGSQFDFTVDVVAPDFEGVGGALDLGGVGPMSLGPTFGGTGDGGGGGQTQFLADSLGPEGGYSGGSPGDAYAAQYTGWSGSY